MDVSEANVKNTTFSPIVHLDSVHLSFGTKPIFNGFGLELEPGSVVAILGPGGCGKSTLVKTILGITPVQSGTVKIFGKDPSSMDQQELASVRRRMGVAFQQGALFDFLTVRENILFALKNMTKLDEWSQEDLVQTFLAEVNLPLVAHKFPSELSGGMRRRIGIVRALCTNPELVLLDEPTAGLDPVTSHVVINLIHKLAKNLGATMVCVTSSVEVAFTFAKYVYLFQDGKILHHGNWHKLIGLGDPWVEKFLTCRGFTPEQT
jgi:phospholipid/cholesterol/gamma-HCH transport system ATP-binding protein